MSNTKISWERLFSEEKNKPYFKSLVTFIEKERALGKQIFPEEKDVFNAFKYTPLEKLKVVILGQDPYHDVGQAHGLAFSVQEGVKVPPSLQNIYKELIADLKIKPPQTGYLTSWAEQGVLLLNTTLTVEAHKAFSHANNGWEIFTDTVIQKISDDLESVVFLLWGVSARKKASMIDESKHLILESSHPSPLSAYRGFLGCNHFSKCNEYLLVNNKTKINWML
tara:strand:+ start:101 stop:769 length:669 start_codon:yes stop_codon:yes gene_type:complete